MIVLRDVTQKLVLMAYIGDATSTVFTLFYDYKGTIPAMNSFKRHTKKYGILQSIYQDRHSTHKSSRKLTTEEEIEGMEKLLSQLERALGELGATVTHAYYPQAKGRAERLFGTLQDRLIKEMQLNGVNTKNEANKFLRTYLPAFNRLKAGEEKESFIIEWVKRIYLPALKWAMQNRKHRMPCCPMNSRQSFATNQISVLFNLYQTDF